MGTTGGANDGVPAAALEPTYTTVALVRKRVKSLSSALLDADIKANILQVESVIDSVMKITGRGTSPDFTFDAAKHGIIRNCATDYAAYLCITYDPTEFATMEAAEMTANLLWNSVQASLAILSDARVGGYLKSL